MIEDGMPKMRAFGMSITLTENDENNGPLMLIPGSHKSTWSVKVKHPKQHFKALAEETGVRHTRR